MKKYVVTEKFINSGNNEHNLTYYFNSYKEAKQWKKMCENTKINGKKCCFKIKIKKIEIE